METIRQVEDRIHRYISSGVHAIQIVVGSQAQAAVEMLTRIANKMGIGIAVWNPAEGYGPPLGGVNPVQGLSIAVNSKPFGNDQMEGIIVMHDLHYDLNAIPALVTLLKKYISEGSLNRKIERRDGTMESVRRPLFILTTNSSMNPDVLPYLKVITMPLPSQEELSIEFDHIQESIESEEKKACSPELRHSVIGAMSGLTCGEAADALGLALITHGRFTPEMLDTIEFEKSQLLKKSNVLTYMPKSAIMSLPDLGGFSELKTWLDQRSIAYTPEAESLRLPFPKGMVLVGVPGTGKSMCAKMIAKRLNQPLLHMDLSSVFNSLVGESERNTREAIQVADAFGGCVLLIDEADKALGGVGESSGDSGVTRRIFGQILTWLAEKKTKTFVVLTMNRVTGMPPELLRRGRFDEVFFVDTPDATERREIFEIHMRNNHVDPAGFNEGDWSKIVDASEEFVGAEIEQSVVASRFAAYAQNKQSGAIFDTDTLLSTIKSIVPVTRMDPENISAIRQFGRERARNVSGQTQRIIKQQVRSMDLTFSDPNLAR